MICIIGLFWTYSFYIQVYNEELEGIAQEFAERCIFDHSDREERNSKSPMFTQVGENIYVGAGLPVNYTDIIARQWGFDEAVDYNYQSNTCTPGRVCGHYTQVMDNSNVHLDDNQFDFMII